MESEKELPNVKDRIGTDALQWLNRSLIYNQMFLTFFLNDYEDESDDDDDDDECEKDGPIKKVLTEDLTQHFSQAYQLTLKRYHGWIVQKLFNCCLMAVPTRTNLLKYLGYLDLNLPQENLKPIISQTMKEYILHLKSNTDTISLMLTANGIQP